MAKANASYETIFVVDMQPGEEAVKAMVEKFTSLIAANGEISEVNRSGAESVSLTHQRPHRRLLRACELHGGGGFPRRAEPDLHDH